MNLIDRRDFLKKSSIGMATLASSGLWFDKLLAGSVTPAPNIFSDRFGVSSEDMQKILSIALSKGGRFSELFFQYSILNFKSIFQFSIFNFHNL